MKKLIFATSSFGFICAALFIVTPVLTCRAADFVGEIVDLSRVDSKPELKKEPKLRFKKRGVEGEVTLRFIVNAEGKVQDIIIVSFNDSDFVEPAYVAYENAAYTPAIKDGNPVATRIEVKIVFAAK